ncbi:MAG TPA: condensation domain-containing protein, partial [Pilimelia sp.]|nr:condensation domain-containing protein [Pilimelia sp.]
MRRMLRAEGLGDAPAGGGVTPRGQRTAPLSAAQRRMWFHQQLSPGSAAYNICVAIRLDGPLDAARFAASVRAAVGRHDILRTTYRAAEDGTPSQVVRPELVIDVPVTDADDAAVDAYARADGARPFDLAGEPPIRLRLLRLGPTAHVLLLVAHHIAWDDASWQVLLGDVARGYAGAEPAAEPPVRYADFAAWEHERPPAPMSYWLDRLTPPPAGLALPTDRPRPPTPDETGGRGRSVGSARP